MSAVYFDRDEMIQMRNVHAPGPVIGPMERLRVMVEKSIK
jgi:hypothetical protein